MTKKEIKQTMDYHQSCFLGHLIAYNRSPGTEQAAFDMAAKHAAIFNALSLIATKRR